MGADSKAIRTIKRFNAATRAKKKFKLRRRAKRILRGGVTKPAHKSLFFKK